MKTNFFTLIITCMLLVVLAVPTFAASSKYNFTMNYRVVDGSENGEYHTLSAGKAYIYGTHRQFSSVPNPTGPNTINYQLYNATSGNNFGIVKAIPNSYGEETTVSGTYSGLGGGTKYYLFIWRVDDGRDIKGSGSIYN